MRLQIWMMCFNTSSWNLFFFFFFFNLIEGISALVNWTRSYSRSLLSIETTCWSAMCPDHLSCRNLDKRILSPLTVSCHIQSHTLWVSFRLTHLWDSMIVSFETQTLCVLSTCELDSTLSRARWSYASTICVFIYN